MSRHFRFGILAAAAMLAASPALAVVVAPRVVVVPRVSVPAPRVTPTVPRVATPTPRPQVLPAPIFIPPVISSPSQDEEDRDRKKK